MQIFPAATRLCLPWKNGGGITKPVASVAGGSLEFGWRLSLADVNKAGPFSCFPGISRLMGILQGCLELQIEGQPTVTLRAANPAFAFPGDVPTYGAPLEGPVQDINLMFDPSCFAATLDYAPDGLEHPANEAAHLILALAPLKLNGTGEPTGCRLDPRTYHLERTRRCGLDCQPNSNLNQQGSGKILPGFMIPSGSIAFFNRTIRSTASPCSSRMYGIFPTPTPCSPVHVPPTEMA